MTEPVLSRIRPLGPADAEAYRDLRLRALAEVPEAFGASHVEEAAKPLSAFAERLNSPPPSVIFGAFAESGLAGVAGFHVFGSEKHRHIGLLWGVYVVPEARGRGSARALLETLIAHARRHVVILQADVGAANLPARRLYDSLGFRSYGVKPKALQVNGAYVDEALLALDFSVP